MEEAVDKLQNAFKLTELNLDYLEKRVESEFVDSAAGDDNQEESPAALLQRLADVKKEYAEIMKDVEEIKIMQTEAVGEFRNELLMACQNLQKLQLATGIRPCSDLDYTNEAEKLSLNLDVENCRENSRAESCASRGPADPVDSSVSKKSQQQQHFRTEFEQMNKSPYSKRENAADFIEISTEEFNSVSTLVRKRVKLADVNRTYRLLWEHFKVDKTGAPLTPTEMDKMSLRVAGATGEAKLKVLRALKLVKISKKGDVSML